MTEESGEKKRQPQHVRFLNSGLRWDWRKENAVELILLVFLLTFFFALPRAGCGITNTKAANASVEASGAAQGSVVKTPPEDGVPEG